jgi:hypothetical protein
MFGSPSSVFKKVIMEAMECYKIAVFRAVVVKFFEQPDCRTMAMISKNE